MADRHCICAHCGAGFVTSTKRKTCSESCRRALISTRPFCVCKHCGKRYKPKKTGYVTFCSRECSFAAKRVERVAPFTRVYLNQCTNCGESFFSKRARKFCKRDCEKEDARIKYQAAFKSRAVHEKRKCKSCGADFISRTAAQDMCHPRCGRSRGRNARRAKYFGAVRGYFKEQRIFMRDGWKCQLCGRKTPKSHRGKNYPSSPEIDHIIPLSAGGGHIQENVQCVCRECNNKKSAKVLGQTWLPGFADIIAYTSKSYLGASKV